MKVVCLFPFKNIFVKNICKLSEGDAESDISSDNDDNIENDNEDSAGCDTDDEEEVDSEDEGEVELPHDRAVAIAKIRKIYNLFKRSPKKNDVLQICIEKVRMSSESDFKITF